MRFWERVAPIVVPFLIVIAVTEVLYFFKVAVHAHHLVFFYLLPTAFIAIALWQCAVNDLRDRRNLDRRLFLLRSRLYLICV